MDFFYYFFSFGNTKLERRKRDENTLIKTISLCILTYYHLIHLYASIGEPVDIAEEYSILSSTTYEEGMNVDAKSALLVEPVSGTVLYEKL